MGIHFRMCGGRGRASKRDAVDDEGEGGGELVESQDTDGRTDADYGAEILRNSNWLSWRTDDGSGEQRPSLLTVKNAWRPPQSATGRPRWEMQVCLSVKLYLKKCGNSIINLWYKLSIYRWQPCGRSSKSLSISVSVSFRRKKGDKLRVDPPPPPPSQSR